MEPKKILLVEDDNFIRELYQRELEKVGYLVRLALDGKEALDILKSEHFDLVLLDIMIPQVDGLQVLETLKKDEKSSEIKVIVLSNLGQEELLNKALQLGAQAYLIKSANLPAKVVELVQESLESSKSK